MPADSSSPLATLCPNCAAIFAEEDALIFDRTHYLALLEDDSTAGTAYEKSALRVHHVEVSDMAQNAAQGCYICSTVWRHFFPEKPAKAYLEAPFLVRADEMGRAAVHAFMGSGTHYRLVKPQGSYYSNDVVELEIGLNSPMRGVQSDLHIPLYKSLTLSPLTDEQCDGFDIDIGHALTHMSSLNVCSGGTWDTISTWVMRCCSSHVDCNAGQEPEWYPSRLLDLGPIPEEDPDPISEQDDQDSFVKDMREALSDSLPSIRLVESYIAKPTGPYVTLTHRWQKEPSITTTKDNIAQMLEGIEQKSLSTTFSQAVDFTRKLGARYLWIDSLCIIQQDAEDWKREAGMMGRVYANSFLTLSATAGGGKLFQDRELDIIKPCVVMPKWKHKDSQTYVVTDFRFWDERIYRSPTNTRCWITQERWLSPRVLHFASDQLVWECRELEACETFPGCLPRETRRNKHCGFKRRDKSDPAGHALLFGYEPPAESDEQLAHRDWVKVLETYARTEATSLKDRFAGIEIVADRFAQKVDDTFMAGLWRRNLIGDLLWYVKDVRRSNWLSNDMFSEATGSDWSHIMLQPRKRAFTSSTRVEPYLAPSWSWLSVLGDIDAGEYCSEQTRAMVEVVDVTVDYLDPQKQFAGIKGASLKLRGRLYPITGTILGLSNYLPPRLNIAGMSVSQESSTSNFSSGLYPLYDQPEDLEDILKSCFLPVARQHVPSQYAGSIAASKDTGSISGPSMIHGLFLMPTGVQGQYRRLGRLNVDDKRSGFFDASYRAWQGKGFDSLCDDHLESLDKSLYQEGSVGALEIV